MDKFEKIIKDSVQGYEAPYNPDAWKSLNKKLGPSKATITKWIATSAAAITLLAISYNYIGTENEINENNIIAKEIIDNSINNTNKDKGLNTETEKINTKEKNTKADSNSPITDEKVIENSTPKNSQVNNEVRIAESESNIDTGVRPLPELTVYIEEENTINSSNTIIYNAGVNINGTEKCLTEEFVITPSAPKQKVIYEWDLGDGTITTGDVVNHSYKSAGTYSVQLTLKDLNTRKVVKSSKSIDVTVLSAPQTIFTYESSNGIVPQTTFKNETRHISSIQWEIVGLKASTRPEFTYSFKRKGDFVVKLTTTAENGCSNTDTKVIKVEKDYNLLAPTVFSPNDDYLNDNFIPKALPLIDLPFTMVIYDRQGNLVYQTTDANQPWDGLYTKDGIPAPNGIYVWAVQLTNESGEIEIFQDQVIIAR
jgi:gliding motility-associated-like protein